MKKFVKHGIAIIGIAVLVFLAVGSAATTPATIHLDKGKEYYRKKDYDQAITELTESIRLDPNNTNAYLYRCYAYEAIKDFDHAIADVDKVIQLSPSFAGGYNTRAWIYAWHLKKDFNRAISDANQALKLKPNEANYLDTRGWAYLGNGDYDKAKADFEKALEINSDLESSKKGLAQVRLAQSVPQPVKDEDFDIKQNTDNTITITNYKGSAKSIIIPDKLYGLKVTIIGNRAFRAKELISVVIPDTVVTIEDGEEINDWVVSYVGAFLYNEKLIKVTLGKGIKTIGDYAFRNCGLTEIIIPDSVTRIGDYAFQGNEIAELNLPSSLKEIPRYAFSDNKIQKLTLGTGLQTIGRGAFQKNQITEFNLPSSLKQIPGGAFSSNKIQVLNLPNGITSIGVSSDRDYNVGAFADNPLTTVIIPASLANGSINTRSFGNINGNTITRITIPAGMNEWTLSANFEDAFVNFWINQNRAGGTYVKRGPIWAKE